MTDFPACPRMSKRHLGFTLVELLVVIGMLLILAGIAAANWSESVIRAKVARVQSDFRTLATAIELYAVDQRSPPRMRHAEFYQDYHLDTVEGIPVNGTFSPCLSTPVAYISTVRQLDPFTVGVPEVPLDEQFYTYQVLAEYVRRRPTSLFWKNALEFYGQYRLMSSGPDQHFDHNFVNSAQLLYDSTNGTISAGNIIRSGRHTQQVLPPIPQLLGNH